MKIKTSELIGAQLNWAVALVSGISFGIIMVPDRPVSDAKSQPCIFLGGPGARRIPFFPSTDWSQGGPLIEKFGVDLSAPPCIDKNREIGWQARPDDGETYWHSGGTALIAAMRAIVAAKLGEEIEVPEELV